MKKRSTKASSLAQALESRYWSEVEAGAVLSALERSGDPASVFARRHGLSPHRLLRWKNRQHGSTRRSRPAFHPVQVEEPEDRTRAVGSEERGGLELLVDGSRRIVVRRGFDPEVLRELLRVLESRPC
jgi:hypothetical protein